jgi:hypothetical protein
MANKYLNIVTGRKSSQKIFDLKSGTGVEESDGPAFYKPKSTSNFRKSPFKTK